MKKLIVIPALISSLRFAALPLFFYLYNRGSITTSVILLAFCVATDFLDGYLARQLHVSSRFGAYWDATTDFILIIGIFGIFYSKGYYPAWLLVLIAVSFAQFLATSYFSKKVYDPVGRYFGSALYIGIALTLLWPTEASFIFVQCAFVVFFLISLLSRIGNITSKKSKLIVT